MPFNSMGFLQQLLGQQAQGGAQQPPSGGPQPVQPGVTPGTTPPTMPGPSGIGTSPMLQQALARMSNPQSNTIPQQPQQIPQGADHPVLRHILQGLGAGLQGAGYGAMTGGQQANSQELEAKKAETMANLAATQQWREGMLGLGEQKVGVANRRADTAEQLAQTAQEKVEAYKQLGQKRNQIMAEKSEWEKDIQQGNLDNALQRTINSENNFHEGLQQKAKLFQEDMDYKNLALESQNFYKEAYQNIARTALAQGGISKLGDIYQKSIGTNAEHFIQAAIGEMPNGQQIMQQIQSSGMPGVATPAGALGTPSPGGTPPMPPTGAPPTPQAKASAKSKAAKPSSGGGAVAPEGTKIQMPDGSYQTKQGGKWVTSNQ